jgi:hypothetical protein
MTVLSWRKKFVNGLEQALVMTTFSIGLHYSLPMGAE